MYVYVKVIFGRVQVCIDGQKGLEDKTATPQYRTPQIKLPVVEYLNSPRKVILDMYIP